MKFANPNAFMEEEKLDERQNALRGEIAHECMQLWYVLNVLFTIISLTTVLIDFIPALPAAVFIVGYFIITFLCLSIYNFKSAQKGILASFTGFKFTRKGNIGSIVLCIFCIGVTIAEHAKGTGVLTGLSTIELGSVILMFLAGIIFDIVSILCVKKNKAVINEQFEEE